jgi:hypothetical protein
LELSEKKQDKEKELSEENEKENKDKNGETLSLQASELMEKQPSATEGRPLHTIVEHVSTALRTVSAFLIGRLT